MRRVLQDAGMSRQQPDRHGWELEKNNRFSVRSLYDRYVSAFIPFGSFEEFDEALTLNWDSDVPFKIKAFIWSCLINRLPTGDLLDKRGLVASTPRKCVLCELDCETLDLLMINCCVARLIWREVAEWVGFSYGNSAGMKGCFMDWFTLCKGNKMKKGKEGVFWAATCWSIWLSCNGIIFRGVEWNVCDTVWRIKALIWHWSFVGNITYLNCNFYEFCKDLDNLHELKYLKKFKESKSTINKGIKRDDKRVLTKWNNITYSLDESECENDNIDLCNEFEREKETNIRLMIDYKEDETRIPQFEFIYYELFSICKNHNNEASRFKDPQL
ncbi:uncharacterized protein LOC131597716 [Vicia villosa]|uniref:uncharacterized protein LOC131597716 n=1 Tax=Vicia villosa TaxID=3911 RepID=UPI00273CD83C|nr:uncharacterized protein LOC131597716 [Vicia villosa]